MKKFALILVCLLMTIACIAIAEDNPTFYTCGNYTYILKYDGTALITGYTGTSEIVYIPEELDGHVVTSIGVKAFAGCDSLTEITIPDSVTSIGGNLFAGCGKLIQIKVSLEHPTLATIDGVLFDKREKKLIGYPNAFTAKSYSIPQGISSIGEGAFARCESLTEITIPDSVTSIGDYAFSSCESLTEITIPDSVTYIDENAFYGCESLTEITIPDSVTYIGENAFYGCASLTLTVKRDSYAAQYAKENNIEYMYPDSLDWLNS